MSTRANVRFVDSRREGEIWFYRHSDGYPGSVMPDLLRMSRWLEERRIQDNISQASGWLVAIGIVDMYDWSVEHGYQDVYRTDYFNPGGPESSTGWKVGYYEPDIGQASDIEYRYTFDLSSNRITAESGYGKSWREICLWPSEYFGGSIVQAVEESQQDNDIWDNRMLRAVVELISDGSALDDDSLKAEIAWWEVTTTLQKVREALRLVETEVLNEYRGAPRRGPPDVATGLPGKPVPS